MCAVPISLGLYVLFIRQSRSNRESKSKDFELPLEFLLPESLTYLEMFNDAYSENKLHKYAEDLVDG